MYRTIKMIIAVCVVLAVFAHAASNDRKERVMNSPNFRDGQFQNISPTRAMITGNGALKNTLFSKVKNRRPKTNVPSRKTDLKQFERYEDVLIWFGHSSFFIQTGGKRFLIDPVLVAGSPVPFINRPFKGTKIYKPEDLPDIDYLIITHNHYDHLDKKTVKRIKNGTANVITPIGVGGYFERWGFDKERIIELDWNEHADFDSLIVIHCLPARHFSGRGILSRNKTLWASFMLQTPARNIYISGDGGYDTHFAEIGRKFPNIDLAIMENGQYNQLWRYIHLLPEDLVQAVTVLNPKRLLTSHNSKFSIGGDHSWYEPMENISNAAEQHFMNLITPMIGEPVYLNDETQVFEKWWR